MQSNLELKLFQEYINENKKRGKKIIQTSVFNIGLRNSYALFTELGNMINSLNITDDLKKKYNDSNLLLMVAFCKITSNTILDNNSSALISLEDNTIMIDDTIFSNVDPDFSFLQEICNERGLIVLENNRKLLFKAKCLDNNKILKK